MNTKYILGPILNYVFAGLFVYLSWKTIKIIEYYVDTRKDNKKEIR